MSTKKIVLFFLITLHTAMSCTHLSMRITDLHNTPIQSAQQGVPFLLEITHDTDTTTTEPIIQNTKQLACFECCPVHTLMTLTNGRQQTQRVYLYKCRYDQPGQYALGPAQIQEGNQLVQSNPIILTVQKCSNQSNNQEIHDPFLHVQATPTTVYTGQQIIITIRLSYQKPITRCQLETLNIVHAHIQPLCEPINQEWHYNGTNYQSFVYQFACYAHAPGTLVIPSLSATVEREKEYEHESIFEHVRSFFAHDHEEVTVQSKPQTITVQPLPLQQPIHGIGEFEKFTLKTDAAQANQSQGITLSMSITGTGDLSSLTLPDVQLPPTIRTYQATTTITRDQKNKQRATRTTSWVLQALAPGPVNIAPCEFLFFNPITQRYQKLHTKPVHFIITPVIITPARPTNACANLCSQYQSIPLPIFVLLVIIPILSMLISCIHQPYQHILRRRFDRWWHAYRLKRACAHKQAQTVHDEWFLWYQAFTQEAPTHTTLEELGTKILTKKADQNAWQVYVRSLQHAAFGTTKKLLSAPLRVQTREWIDLLEKLP